MYYRDPQLFQTQRTVETMVTRACLTLRLPRAALGVCASPSGLVWGRVQLDGRAPLGCIEQLVPDPGRVVGVVSDAAWVLVVEKHAVYQTLYAIDFLGTCPAHGIHAPGAVITGRGYPDQATRALLARWACTPQRPQLFFLLDGDPHGVDILRTYLEALPHADTHWIGLHVRQWLVRLQHERVAAVPLHAADVAKARQLLRRTTLPPRLRHELAEQLHAGYKCELEVLCSTPSRSPFRQSASGMLAAFLYAEIRARLPRRGASRGTQPGP